MNRLVSRLEKVDRRVIYLLVAFSLSVPLLFDLTLTPAEMKTANAFFNVIEEFEAKKGSIVLVAADWGPNTQAENRPQTEVAVEHLLRRRIPFALISNLPFSAPFLEELPRTIVSRLEKEDPTKSWTYGQDWVNLGYRPGGYIMIQGLAKADDLHEVLKSDAQGTLISQVPMMAGVKTIHDIGLLIEVTGSVGLFNYWLQFFQTDGYIPPYLHGCTSVTIPEAYIYFISKQIVGLFEGIAGAAWYEKLLSDKYPARDSGAALKIMTSLSYAHLVIIGFIIAGNLGSLMSLLLKRNEGKEV